MFVKQYQVHLILGPERRDQRMIQERSGCHIVIPKRTNQRPNMRELFLIGTPEARACAQHLIREHISNRDFSGRAGPASVSKTLEVPPDIMRSIIGKGLSP